MLDSAQVEILKRNIGDFMIRDYRRDSAALNKAFNVSDSAFAEDMPPVPYTGNPFSLNSGHCIAFLGLNPRWLGWNNPWANIEYYEYKRIVDAFRMGESNLDALLAHRAVYFNDGIRYYYGRYFTSAGRFIGEHMLEIDRKEQKASDFSRNVFNKYVFKTDLIPWFSNNTRGIDWHKAANSNIDALIQYRELLLKFIDSLQPRWIQCNGLEARPLIEETFEATLHEHRHKVGDRTFRFFTGAYERVQPAVPILVHGFISRSLGREARRIIARDFRGIRNAAKFNKS